MFNLKQTFVCVLMLLALLLQGQVQAAGMRCGQMPGRAGSVAMAPDMGGHQAHPETQRPLMTHQGHPAHADSAETMAQPEHPDDAATIVHASALGHGDCSQLAACCHGAAMPAPMVALVLSPSALAMTPHPAQRPAMALIARLERPPILPLP